MSSPNAQETIRLPEPRYDGSVSVEHALFSRRSVRKYKNEPLTLAEVSQLLWAAQGITAPRGYRTAPSAGALYPLEVYLVAGKVNDLSEGIYKYKYHDHSLVQTVTGDKRAELSRAALHQGSLSRAPTVLLFCAVYERITRKYGERGYRYVFMEIGHAAQNVCLQAIALGLGTVAIGAFRDNEVKKIANLPPNEEPTYFVPVGR
ncbi:MAG: SagB/ThcOx family dehydrogenase [Desulfobacterales bacterium]|nr:MAG: SagB/ThcOx family dehydrogenase [Desulfobacterales bacterium]